MPLKSMKLNRSDVKERETIVEQAPEYPWGLRVSLDEESISKLGLSELPGVGDKKTLIATVEVDSVSQNDSLNGEKRRNVSLQITEMALEEVVKDDTLEKLYGES